jgi:hypothetical protein
MGYIKSGGNEHIKDFSESTANEENAKKADENALLVSGLCTRSGVTNRYYDFLEVIKYNGAIIDTITSNNLLDNLRNDTSLELSQVKKDTLVSMGSTLLDAGFEPAFVSGVLGNIFHEAIVGSFESSAYISNPDSEPDYLKYVDEHFNYRSEFSGKNIIDVGIQKTKKLIGDCKSTNYKGKFGLGCVQWTGSRTMDLINCYINVCENKLYPTKEQCYKAESKLISEELKGRYKNVYAEWLSKYNGKDTAAYEAGKIVCIEYEIPKDKFEKAKSRAKFSQKLYQVMLGTNQ